MEDNHCMIKDIHPRNCVIERVQMTRNYLFPLRIRPTIKEKITQVVQEGKNVESKDGFKEERKQANKQCNK